MPQVITPDVDMLVLFRPEGGGWVISNGTDCRLLADALPRIVGLSLDDEGLLEWFVMQLGFGRPQRSSTVEVADLGIVKLASALGPLVAMAEHFADADDDSLLFLDSADANLTVGELRAIVAAHAALTPNTSQARVAPQPDGPGPKPAEEPKPPPAGRPDVDDLDPPF